MTKYSILLPGSEKDAVLSGIRDLGLLDITRSAKPIDKHSDALLQEIREARSAADSIARIDFSLDPDAEAIAKEAEGVPDFDGDYRHEAEERLARLRTLETRLSDLLKECSQLEPWGRFDANSIARLADKGITLHFYMAPAKRFADDWAAQWPLEVIHRDESNVWFVVAGDAKDIPATEIPAPAYDYTVADGKAESLRGEIRTAKASLLALRRALPAVESLANERLNDLNFYLASVSGEDAAEGMLCVLTAFAPTDDDERIAAALDGMDLYYVREAACKEDNPPIKLKNNWFARQFETLTGMYGMPVYDEFDPTPILAPFFMLFWAFCMGDAGYGLVLMGVALLLDKVNILGLRNHKRLVMSLGVGATVIGFFLGTFFGIPLAEASWVPEGCKKLMLAGKLNLGGSSYDLSMVAAIAVGVFHICLAMIIKAIGLTKRFGFKAAISTWGWVTLIVGGLITAALALTSVIDASVTRIVVIVIGVISALGIFILNKPGRNPLINIGAGLWDTYGMATGILGDVLSYIRLYALGLAGGMLGNAFNNLGGMLLGESPTWQWAPFVLIVVFGHTLNFAMSCLGAFVHPLRLTFVEYFKNSGYEGKGTQFRPFKQETVKTQ
ncbi:MAG: ATPase V [Bacteroidales bacterium]|nr:ATPase V [Bacteroidales bacterium]